MLSRLAKICVLSLWQDSLKLNVGLISMFFLYSQIASDTMLNRKKSNKKGLARWLSWLEHHPIDEGSQFNSWSGHITGLWVQSLGQGE